MAKHDTDQVLKIADTLDTAVEKATSILKKAGVPETLARSACADAISHRMTIVNIENQDTKIAKAAVFALYCENTLLMLLSRFFNTAEIAGIADTDRAASKIQTIVISNLLGHAIDGCLVSTDTEEEAKELLARIVDVIWETVSIRRRNQDIEDESNVEGSSSIH
jgi:hypothetical protein